MTPADFQLQFQAAIELCQQGRYAEARPRLEALLDQATTSDQKAMVAMNLGALGIALGDHTDAEQALSLAASLRPDIPEVHNNLGALLSARGNYAEAAASFRRAIALRATMAEAHYNLGRALQFSDDREGAVASYRTAISLNPSYADAMANLGGVLVELGQLEAAVDVLQKAINLNPSIADAWNNVGQALRSLGRRDDALGAFDRAIALHPDHAIYNSNLGVALFELGRIGEAMAKFELVMAKDPLFAAAHNNAGLVRERQGRMGEAIDHYRRATELDPSSATFHSNFLFAVSYARALPPAELKREHEIWGERHGRPEQVRPAFSNARNASRKLRIGYISPDFREHAVAYFIAPVLTNHDRREVEIFAYSEAEREDAITERIKRLSDHWYRTTGASDRSIAERIAADGIDILIDLAGHTAGNRLKAIARKPAPVQATYIGYFATTGVSAIDWWITDPILNPADTSECFTERLCRLDRCWVCYEPDARAPEPEHRGIDRPFTFGSFNQLQKLSSRAIALWARALRAVPESRLLLKTRTLTDRGEQQRILSAFANEGIAADRIELRGHAASISEHFASYGDIDVALDPFPCNGGTTTADALWMGVPVLTRPGATMIERMSASMLHAIGQTETVTASDDDFVAKAVELASSNRHQTEQRREMRQIMRSSALCDGLSMARSLEAAYRRMWQDWLEVKK